MDNNEKLIEAKKTLVKKILNTYGIELSVSGCGCCNSPNFSFSHNGQVLFDNESSFDFSTKDEEGVIND